MTQNWCLCLSVWQEPESQTGTGHICLNTITPTHPLTPTPRSSTPPTDSLNYGLTQTGPEQTTRGVWGASRRQQLSCLCIQIWTIAMKTPAGSVDGTRCVKHIYIYIYGIGKVLGKKPVLEFNDNTWLWLTSCLIVFSITNAGNCFKTKELF